MKKTAPAQAKRKMTKLEKNQFRSGLVFILPSLILCTVFMLIPLFDVIRYSFTDWDGMSRDYNFVGLSNYLHLNEIEGFGEMMIATITFAIRYYGINYCCILYHSVGAG